MEEKIASLSLRERQVLRLMGEGMHLSEVAEKLSLSPSTVATQANRAAQKLGARHSLHAASLFFRHELQEQFKLSTWGKK